MAEYATLARPYGNAVFSFAKSAGALPRWSHLLNLLGAAVAQAEVRVMVESPDLTAERKVDQLATLCEEAMDEAARRFLRALAGNGRLLLLDEVRCQFEALRAQEERVLDVEVYSARPLTDAQAQKLESALKSRFGKAVNLSSRVDAGLIGGAFIRAGDMVIDGSVRGRLARLEEALAQV